MTKKEISDIIFDDMKRGAIESRKLKDIEHEHEFTEMMFTIIENMKRLSEKYQALLQAYLSGDEPQDAQKEER